MGKKSTYPSITGQHRLTHQPGGEDVIIGIAPGLHEATHVLAGADDIDSPLDARAIALAAQGDIVYLSGVANTLANLAPGVAGQALLTGGPAANPTWGAPAPAAHEGTHVAGGADDIDVALDARALGLTAQGEIVYHAAAVNTLATLAVGAAGQALLSGGAGANVSWGAPAPAAHVLDTTGPHTGTLLLTDLEVGAQGEIITRTAADWAALGVGAANEALLSGGAGANVSWGAPPPATHESTHVSGGSDDIDSALDGRAIGFSEQGSIVYASGATTLAQLFHGNAGQALLSQGHGANPIWGAPAVAAHEATHVKGGADDIDAALDARAVGLANQGEIVFHAAAANTLVALGVGTAGQVLVSGGAGADISWGSAVPDPLNYRFDFNNLAVNTDEWLTGGDGAFSVGPVYRDDEPTQYQLRTTNVDGEAAYIHGNEKHGLVFTIEEEDKTTVTFETRVRLSDSGFIRFWFGLLSSVITTQESTPPNSTGFYNSGGANWRAENENGAAEDSDTGVALDTSWHTFKIVWDASDILYYIDDVLKATHSAPANFPQAPCRIEFLVEADSNSVRTMYVDWVTVDVT